MLLLQKLSSASETLKTLPPETLSITEMIANFATHFIETTGYIGIMVLMTLESMVAPVPSEAVMPFAGMLIYKAEHPELFSNIGFTPTWFGVIFFSTLGSIIGSLISYWIGAKGGRPVVERWGKYLLLDKHDLDITEKWFAKRGEAIVFVCRFIPVVRHLISIPAGMGKMNLWKFVIYTVIGAGLWNSLLAIAGYYLQDNWKQIMKYSHIIDYFVVGVIIIIVLYYVYKLFKNKKKAAASQK